jgi:hypothetical protein
MDATANLRNLGLDAFTRDQLHDYHQRMSGAAARLSAQCIDMLNTYPALPLIPPVDGELAQHYQCLKAAAAEAHELATATYAELNRRREADHA